MSAIPEPSRTGTVEFGSPQGELAEFGYRQELRRSLSTTDLIVYGLVFMVPIAPWRSSERCTTRPRAWCRWST
jgi:hypothetical protein